MIPPDLTPAKLVCLMVACSVAGSLFAEVLRAGGAPTLGGFVYAVALGAGAGLLGAALGEITFRGLR